MIEELAESNYGAPSKASGSSNKLRSGGMLELNKMSTIEAKLDAIMTIMNNQKRRNHAVNEVGIMEGVEQKSVVDL